MQECVRARPGIASRREPPVTRGGIAAALTLIALQIVAVHAIPTRLWGLSAAAFAPRWMEPVLVVFARPIEKRGATNGASQFLRAVEAP